MNARIKQKINHHIDFSSLDLNTHGLFFIKNDSITSVFHNLDVAYSSISIT